MKKRGLILLICLVFIIFFILNIKAVPIPSFTSPTLNDGAETTDRDLKINISVTEPSLLSEIKFNINNINYSINNSDLILMYNFDKVNSLGENTTHVVDVARGIYNGTIANYTTWNATGKYGGAFEFNGTNSYIKTGLRNIDIANNFTISFWMKTTSPNYTFPMAVRDSVSPNPYIYVRAQIDTTNRMEFIVYNGSALIGARYDSSTWRDGFWHQLTFVKRGNTADFLYIYLDGNEATITRPWNTTIGSRVITQDFYVGALNNAGTAAGFMNASMDEIRFYNRSLSATEIAQNYNTTNLNKYDIDKWSFYSDLYDLSLGNNSYSVAVSNLSGSENQTEIRNVTLMALTTKYYDNRKAVVVVTADDYGGGGLSKHIDGINCAQLNKIVITPAIITNESYTNSTAWQLLQSEIDEGFVFPASHSISHPHANSGNQTSEVCDSKADIIGNLTLPWQNTFNGSEFVVGWVSPYGETSASQRSNLSACNYLADRTVSLNQISWAPWDDTYGLYQYYGVTTSAPTGVTLYSLNTNFTNAYNNNGIYHLWFHPYSFNWTDGDVFPQHFSYIGGRTDVWYVGWGELYTYHYLDERYRPTINVTYHDDTQILAKVNISNAERNKYGLSYPLTYSFYLPSSWQYAFVLYKNTSNENYTAMTEKTGNDYWNDIDAYRENASGRVIYVSKAFPQNYSEFYLKIIPIRSTNFDGLSTDLTTNLTAVNISNITNLILENSSYGKINFSESVNLSRGGNLDEDVIISYKYISINTTNLPALNEPATLTFYDLDFSDPVIVKDGEICSSSICQQVNYSGGNLTINVTGFSTYSINCTGPWSCTEWTSCQYNQQTRICSDVYSCGTLTTKPAENQSCSSGSGLLQKNATAKQNITETEEELEISSQPIWNNTLIIVAVWGVIILTILALVKIMKKRKRKK